MSNEISEYDAVEVAAKNPEVPEAEVGDRAAVLMVYQNSEKVEAFEIEYVLPEGSNKWQGLFSSGQIKLVQKV
ncbi:hypothetical protein [Microbulbifer epialgicus]|uniref:DUF4926 domain-containing protein n=1 Tax=Microbulbifer epialgicus TaxID=393907 RepID=A0ABV4NYD2_9GAMM